MAGRVRRRNPRPRGTTAVPRPGGRGRRGVPRGLDMTTRWVWRLVLLGGAAYLAVRVLALLWLVVVPVLTALLVTALLRPVTKLLRRWVPGAPAALATLLVAVLAVGGLGYLVELRVIQQMEEIVADVQSTVEGLRSLLGPIGLRIDQVPFTRIEQMLTEWAQSHSNDLFGYLATGLGYVAELVTFVVLTLFVTFFLLKDGGRIWRFLTGLLPRTAARRVDRAGHVAWGTLTGYVHGTVVIAVIHTIVIGGVAFLLGVPLVVPIAVIVFLGSFVPIVGALVGGGIGVLVTLGTRGWVAALILLAVLVVEDQLESHLLQPLIVGRYVRLHPLAIGLALAVGTVLFGVVGAIVSVPVAAIVYRAGPALLDRPGSVGDTPRPARERPGVPHPHAGA